MSNLGQDLRLLAKDAVGSAIKRKQVSSCLKKSGFKALGKGAWLGFRNKDVVSGFVIEGSLLDTYISTFILPAFDKRSFVSWGLGDRVVHCDVTGDTRQECNKAIDSYGRHIAHVRSPEMLMDYLEERQTLGHYPIWVTYICRLRLSQFDAAIEYLDASKRSQLHQTQLAQLDEVEGFVAAHDAAGVSRVLQSWTSFSERIFGPIGQTFDRSLSAHRVA